MRIIRWLVVIFFFLFTACSTDSDDELRTIFQSEGQSWSVAITNEVIEHGGKRYFQIHYQYKGALEDLQQVERISFAQGTRLNTQIKNIYDPSYKEKLQGEGQYQEEYEAQYGIVIEPIKHRTTKEFLISSKAMNSHR
ncbi:hypothetical protein [Marinicrinis lubricantis]|uniref:Lipoprotein n=1 Tax=Marinicrinis lubricantis TaxID=2086470 RepID=A0ABW1IRV5_9BACL